jgi:hypothetical protein
MVVHYIFKRVFKFSWGMAVQSQMLKQMKKNENDNDPEAL